MHLAGFCNITVSELIYLSKKTVRANVLSVMLVSCYECVVQKTKFVQILLRAVCINSCNVTCSIRSWKLIG